MSSYRFSQGHMGYIDKMIDSIQLEPCVTGPSIESKSAKRL
jgi:hypothetical protein